jgi:superfamily II RNA helicase
MSEPHPRSFYRNLHLDPFQEQSIACVAAHQSVLVSAPTGSGKTLIADFAVEKILKQGQRCVYTAPIKALSNQKYRDYCALLGKDSVGIMTGDVVINIGAPLVIMTTEVLLNLLHREAARVEGVGCVIFDELHYLANIERGTVWEETLVLLPPEMPIVGLSATIDNIDEIAGWLGSIKKTDVVAIVHKERPVPLRILAYSRETGLDTPEEVERYREREIERFKKTPEFRARVAELEGASPRSRRGGRRRRSPRGRSRTGLFRDLFTETSHLDLIDHLTDKGLLPCLYFAFSRRKCELMAQELRKDLLTEEERRRVRTYLDEKLAEFGHYAAAERLRRLLLQGVGYHHAGLFPFLKEVVETLYEQRLVKVLYCTSTFALGVNMPAKTAGFDGVVKFDGQVSRLLTPLEFFQKAGRAGRRGMDEVGYVVVRRDLRSAESIPEFREEDIQPIDSALNLSYNSVVNLLETYSLEQIEKLLRESFWQFQKRREIEGYRREAEALVAELEAIEGVELIRDAAAVERRGEELSREIAAIERKLEAKMRGSRGEEAGSAEEHEELLGSLLQRSKMIKTLGLYFRRRGTQGKKRIPRLQRRLEQLADRIHHLESYLMDTFHERCAILERLGYLTPEYRFNNGAHVVKHLHIQELLVTELILDGLLDDLDVVHLSALLCCIGQSERRRGDARPGAVLPLDRTLMRRMRNLLRKVRDAGAEAVEPIEINFDYAVVGLLWCQGADFSELLRVSNLDEGDIISCFRQTIDLLKQLKDVYQADEKMIQHLNVCIDLLDRDVVRVVL